MRNGRNMNVDSAISIAAFIIQSLHGDYLDVEHWFEYYDVLDRAVEKWSKPCKRTLVHEYIQDLYLDSQNYLLDKHFPIGQINEMQELLDNYNIDYSSIGDVDVDDVFSILYMDKNFMHEFNRQCSEIILKLKKDDYPNLLREDGVIERISYYPKWFKRGIEYRDKLRCSLCGCDLSSAFTTLVDENFDHIIPLKNGGNNDPSNWQLTCETCNKSKGARSSAFKNIVFPFWQMDDED